MADYDCGMIFSFKYFLLLILITSGVSADFSSEESDQCSKLDSCHSNSVLKTCGCNSDCHAYGTCCHDVRKTDRVAGFQCYSHMLNNPVFAKRSCLDKFRGHVDDILECLDGEVDEMDVRNNLLMTSRKTKVTYWNKHCAKCNDEPATDLEFWNIEVSCPARSEVDRSLIRKNLTFNQDKLQWGLIIDDEFLQCVVKYSAPAYIDEVKHCTPDVIDSCPLDYNNSEVSTKCSEYYAERKHKNSNTRYKNAHCAVCNGADTRELECPGISGPEDSIEEGDFREVVEDVFTDGRWLEKKPGKLFECSRGFLYDPFREKCRSEIRNYGAMTSNSVHNYRRCSLVLFVILVTERLMKNFIKLS